MAGIGATWSFVSGRIVVRCPTQKQTFIAHLGAALQNATSPASYSNWRGSHSCTSCNQDGDDEEDKKASEPARLVAAEVEQDEPD